MLLMVIFVRMFVSKKSKKFSVTYSKNMPCCNSAILDEAKYAMLLGVVIILWAHELARCVQIHT